MCSSLLTIASLVLTKIAVTIYAGDVVVRTLLGIDTVNIFGIQRRRVLGDRAGPGLHHRPVHRARRPARHHVHRRAAGAGADRGFGLHPLRGTERARPWQPDRRLARDGRRGGRQHSSDSPAQGSRLVLGWRCCRARPSSASGTGAPISTSCSACWPARTSSNRAAAPSWRVPQADAGVHLPGARHDRLCADPGAGAAASRPAATPPIPRWWRRSCRTGCAAWWRAR